MSQEGPPVDNLVGVTVPSLGVPIARGVAYSISILLVPAGGAVVKVRVVPDTEYVALA